MPKITSHTPSWLSRPSPGFDLFSSAGPSQANGHSAHESTERSTLRTLAARGAEVFYAAGNEIRWSELVTLRDQAEANAAQNSRQSLRTSRSRRDEPQRQSYRVLKVPGARKIQQLLISPNELYLAIVSSHTVHVAILPDPSHLASEDTSPLKLRTHHIGPTTHVLERSSIASVLWHPLGADGECLVTVTADATVRLWELDRDNRWSFDQPAFAVDLKKLANGSSTASDFSPTKYGTSAGFSPDSFEMEVASACFGAPDAVEESLWPPMTLWIAMREGDVYALCPLLPSRFQQHIFTLQKLLDAERVELAAIQEGLEGVPEYAKQHMKQHLSWISDMESQIDAEYAYDASLPTQTLKRPLALSPVPRLQGPFQLAPDPDVIFDITDICVLTPEPESSIDSEADATTEDEEIASSLETVCLATSDGKVHVCISMNKIEPRWLPTKKSIPASDTEEKDTVRDLLILESINLTDSDETSWPLFTTDSTSSSRAFVTYAGGVAHIDIAAFQKKLGEELSGEGDGGIDFRVGLLTNSNATTCQQLITPDTRTGPPHKNIEPVACANFLDADLGHFVLASFDGQPYALTLETTDLDSDKLSDSDIAENDDLALTLHSSQNATNRPAYAPSSAFYDESSLPSFLDTHVHARSRRSLNEEVRLSPSTLDILMTVHRTLSAETHRLGVAAADLFSRCERLQLEFQEQVASAKEASARVEEATEGDQDEDEEDDTPLRDQVRERVESVRMKQEALIRRYEEVKRKANTLNRRPVNEREREWQGEVSRLGGLVLVDDAEKQEHGPEQEHEKDGEQEDEQQATAQTQERFQATRELFTDLLAQLLSSQDQVSSKPSSPDPTDPETGEREKERMALNVGLERRKARSAEIEGLLERQAALVDGTVGRLQKLRAEII